MHRNTKGALAAAAAGALLLGGAGSLAFWTDTATVDGTSIASGHLKLVDGGCDGGWKLEKASYAGQLLVPGDTLHKVCTFTVDAEGEHLEADFDMSRGTGLTGDAALLDEIEVSSSFSVNGLADADGKSVSVKDGDVIRVAMQVTWPEGTNPDNDSNVASGLTAALDDITVTATQSHGS